MSKVKLIDFLKDYYGKNFNILLRQSVKNDIRIKNKMEEVNVIDEEEVNLMDQDYQKQEHEMKLLYNTFLLADLIWLNYCFSNKEYNNITGKDIWNSIIREEEYTMKEKEKIINNASHLLEIRYQLKLVNFNTFDIIDIKNN